MADSSKALTRQNKQTLVESLLQAQAENQALKAQLQQLNPTLALPNMEARLHQSLDYTFLYAITLKADGTILFCNSHFVEVMGWSKSELIGKNYFDIFPPEEERQTRRKEFESRLQKGAFQADADRVILTRQADARYVHFNWVPWYDSEDTVLGVTIIGEDVTEKHQMYAALRETNAALQDLFDNSNDLILIISMEGSLLFANKTFQKKLGYTSEELKSVNIRHLLHPKSLDDTVGLVKKISLGLTNQRFQTVLLNKQNKPVYLEGSLTFRMEGGKPTAIRGILYDITEKIRAEKAQTLYYSIANLTIKSHDLHQLYHNIHEELKKVIEVSNFYIKLYSADKQFIQFPFYVDEQRITEAKVTRRKAGGGLSDFVMRGKKALFLYQEDIEALVEMHQLNLYGPMPKVWIGVPLKFEDEVIGLISVKCYRNRDTYNIHDLELLDFISGQIALAIQRKQNEAKLQNQTARLQAIFESGSHLMWSLDRRRQLTSFNRNYAKLLEKVYQKRPYIGAPFDAIREDLQKNNSLSAWDAYYDRAFAGESQYFELDFETPDGHQWQEVYLNPIRLADGSIQEVSAIAHDITAKKKSEVALIESEEKFRNIFESFQDIYYRSDLRGRITLISPSLYEMSGYQPEEVMGCSVVDFCIDPDKCRRSIYELFRKGKLRNVELPLRIKDRRVIQSISNLRLVYDHQQKPIAIEGVVRDITELKKISEEAMRAKELAEKSLQVKQAFLANMSHEIRTPMNGIIGMIDLMMSTALNRRQQEYMDTIKKSSETLMHILNDILDLSKIEAGKMELNEAPADIQLVLDKVRALFLQQARSKGNQFEIQREADVPRYLMLDETRLIQIISNLTSNAIKFTEQGQIRLRLEVLEQNNDEYLLKLSVHDTGIGIAPTDQLRLFQTFSQLDNSFSKAYAGTGLGLAISKELCKLMQGDIGVSSTKGQGSVFWFSFKAKALATMPYFEVDEQPEETPTFLEQLKARAPHILVVDDNAVNRKVAGEILKHAGCVVSQAAGGQEAIDLLEQGQTFDLILMDIQMPDMDGVVATQRIRKLALLNTPPIIAMTAYSMKEDREKFLNQGLDDYLPKPINAQALVTKVQTYVLDQLSILQEATGAVESGPSTIIEDLPSRLPDEVVDPAIITQLSKYGGLHLVQETLEEFEQETLQLIEQSENALSQRDYPEALRHLHTLKGNAGTLGINALAFSAQQLESLLKTQQYEKITKTWLELKENFNKFRAYYQQQLNAYPHEQL
jgi:PAS domain S-box-containing protein